MLYFIQLPIPVICYYFVDDPFAQFPVLVQHCGLVVVINELQHCRHMQLHF